MIEWYNETNLYPWEVYQVSATHGTTIETRLARIAGQVSGIRKMVADGRYCVDILNQIAAVRSALDAAGVELLCSHLETCVICRDGGTAHHDALEQTQDDLLLEVRTVLKNFLK